MAKIDELLNHVSNAQLREQLRTAVAEIRDRRQFGLAFEHHIPETVLLSRVRIKPGVLVTHRDGSSEQEWIVEKIAKDVASCSRRIRAIAWSVTFATGLLLRILWTRFWPIPERIAARDPSSTRA